MIDLNKLESSINKTAVFFFFWKNNTAVENNVILITTFDIWKKKLNGKQNIKIKTTEKYSPINKFAHLIKMLAYERGNAKVRVNIDSV